MPSSEAILSGLTAIANEWQQLALVWHAWLAALIVALLAGWRPSNRISGALLIAPVLSVGALAWVSGNPFNGAAFAILAVALATITNGLTNERVRVASSFPFVSGVLLVAFGWIYPHFLSADSWAAYTYASPLGLVPCPTLAVLIGVTLILDRLGSTPWCTTLIAAGSVYGAIGVFRLGVVLDCGLLAGVGVLTAVATREKRMWRAARTTPGETFKPGSRPDNGQAAQEHAMTITPSTQRTGFWSAALATVFSITYVVGQLAEWAGLLGSAGGPGSASTPLGILILLTPSLFLGSSFVVLAVSIHQAAAPERKVWSQVAVAFATAYATLISLVYFVQLTWVGPRLARGDIQGIEVFLFAPFDSFLYAVDILGYSFMSVATLFAAMVFTRNGLERVVRLFLTANGLLLPFIALQMYFHPLIWIAALWAVTFPGSTWSLAMLFRRARTSAGALTMAEAA